jgi:hypothetical protein
MIAKLFHFPALKFVGKITLNDDVVFVARTHFGASFLDTWPDLSCERARSALKFHK